MATVEPPVWFYVDASTGQPVGPFDEVGLQGLLSSGHVKVDTPVWREGQAEWVPIQGIHELQHLVKVVLELQKAKPSSAQPAVDDLEAFQAEIAQLEAAADDPDVGDGPATPEELEFEDDDGTWYVWDSKQRKYVPKGGGDVPAAADYSLEDMVYAVEDELLPTLEAVRAAEEEAAAAAEAGPDHKGKGKGQKRGAAGKAEGSKADAAAGKAEDTAGADGEGAAAAAEGTGKPAKKKFKSQVAPQQPPPEPKWFELKNNTSIYINGLPLDVTIEEVHEAVSKFGLVKEDDQRRPRIKLYRNQQTGELKGDALVTFLKEPSVALAVNLLDGTQLRPGSGPKMMVQPAKFEMKGEAYVPKAKPSKKAKKAILEAQAKRLGWGGYDDKLPAEKVTVVLSHMFDPQELASELGGATELEAEVLAEATKIGPVEKVRVYKEHPDGVVTVKFKQEEHAQSCLIKMHGRFFGGQRIIAAMWDGTNLGAIKIKESAEEQEARLEAYARELEAKEAAKEAEAKQADAEMQQ